MSRLVTTIVAAVGMLTASQALAGDPALCTSYAERAVVQYTLVRNSACPQGPDKRWHGNRSAHYQWCLGAPPAAAHAENGARDKHIAACGIPGG